MRTSKRILAVCAICAIVCLSLIIFTTDAAAQPDSQNSKNLDKSQASKRGVSGALTTSGSNKDDNSGSPSKLQMGVGFGSIFVMLAVMRYL